MHETRTYYAFAESIERLTSAALEDFADQDKAWWNLLSAREERYLPPPTHMVWFDCVDAVFFDEQNWRHAPVDYSNPKARAQRLSYLEGLDESWFVVALLPICARHVPELVILANHLINSWHEITIGPDANTPAIVGPDYDVTTSDGARSFVTYNGPVSDKKRDDLYSVFNVDFLEEFGVDEEGPGSPEPAPDAPPLDPEPDPVEVAREVIEMEGSRSAE